MNQIHRRHHHLNVTAPKFCSTLHSTFSFASIFTFCILINSTMYSIHIGVHNIISLSMRFSVAFHLNFFLFIRCSIATCSEYTQQVIRNKIYSLCNGFTLSVLYFVSHFFCARVQAMEKSNQMDVFNIQRYIQVEDFFS